MIARRINCEVSINGKNISKDLQEYLLSVSVSDVLDGETNSAEIELEDRDQLWMRDWFPQRGDSVKLSFKRENWLGDEQVETFDFDCWEIDEIANSFPPNVCKLRLNSVSSNSNLKSSDKSKSWENVKLSKIASDIASDCSQTLYFDAKTDPDIERAEQKNESNLSFLHKLCKKYGIILRVSEKKLILADEEQLESAAPVVTFKYGDDKIKTFRATATLSEIYSSAEVEYADAKTKTNITGKFEDKDKGGGKVLKIKKKVSNKAEADALAKKELRDKNKKEISVSVEVIGDFCYLAGNVIALENFGFYTGNYIIDRANWKIGSGFSCSLELRKCLNGY